MNFNKMYGLFLRHIYLIKGSLPRILILFIGQRYKLFFGVSYQNFFQFIVIIIVILLVSYSLVRYFMILFRSSISFNMLFLEEIWSRNFTNLFIAPIKN